MKRLCSCGMPLYFYKGEWSTLAALAKRHGIKRPTLRNRIETLGWPVKLAIETPLIPAQGTIRAVPERLGVTA